MEGSVDFEKLYKAFFKGSLEGILVLDKGLVIRFVNPGAEQILGYQSGELNNKGLDTIIPRKLQQQCFEICGQFFSSDKKQFGVKTMVTLQKKESAKIVAEISLVHYADQEQGSLLIAMFSDITERYKAEKDLKEERMLYVNVLEKMEDSFISFDHEWHFTYINDKAFQFFSQKEIKTTYINQILWEVFPEIKGTIFETEYKKVMEKREPSIFESDFLLKGRWFEISVFPHDGGVAVFYKDITEKRNVQTSLRELNEILEKKVHERTVELREALEREKENNDLKSRFVSTASHEFRTPLACLLTSVSILEKYVESENKENITKHLNRIKSSVQILTDILEDFLSLDKLEHGKIETVGHPFDFKEMVELIIEEMSGILKQGQSVNYTHVGDNVIFQDKKIIFNTLVNLLSNAIKYSPENKPIDIHTEVNDQDVICSIKDEGMGVPQEEQKNIFTLFFRAKNVETIQGSGLGLVIVKKYMELVGGRISFKSIENEGSTFTVIFPRVVEEK